MYKPAELEKFFVGLDSLYTSPFFFEKTEYPRYNIGKSTEGYNIMVALPGWSTECVSVDFHDGVLSVKGLKQETDEKVEWVHKGISGKSFHKVFKIDSSLEVTSADLKDGMLSIQLEYTPSSKPVNIPINKG